MTIPKIIHYCWFGGNPLPDSAKQCIDSWKKYCPDYEIKRWDESNFDIYCCRYVREAYQEKKWAFVSDYARMDILYRYGGVYLDTDVEIIKNLDSIIEKGPFMGMERDFETNGNCVVNTGLGIACYKEHILYKKILEYYNQLTFINQDGSLNQTTVVDHVTNILREYGLKDKPGIQIIQDIYIYPKDYFCPKLMNTDIIKITENTHTIHHFDSSWADKEDKLAGIRLVKLQRIFGERIGRVINVFIYSIRKYGVFKSIHKCIRKWRSE